MDGDRPMVDGRDLLEFELQDLIRKVWNEACKYGNVLCYAGVDKEVFLRGYDCDIHELLISYLDGPTGDVGFQNEASEEVKKTFRYTFKEFDDILPSTKPQVDEAF